MLAFGIDPGSRFTGWGVVESIGSSCKMIDCGVVAVPEKRPLPDRLQDIFRGLDGLLQRHRPDAVFLESIFHHKSARSALVLGHARGVAMLACGLRALPVEEISPAEVKKAVTGRGRADKTQVQEMMRALLGLPEVAQTDASDALAVAFAGATRARFAGLIAADRPVGPRGRRPGWGKGRR